jgi:hypothetical protein
MALIMSGMDVSPVEAIERSSFDDGRWNEATRVRFGAFSTSTTKGECFETAPEAFPGTTLGRYGSKVVASSDESFETRSETVAWKIHGTGDDPFVHVCVLPSALGVEEVAASLGRSIPGPFTLTPLTGGAYLLPALVHGFGMDLVLDDPSIVDAQDNLPRL